MKVMVLIAWIATAISLFPQPARSADIPPRLAPREEGWLVKSYDQIEVATPPKDVEEDITGLKAIVAKRTRDDVLRFHWWAAGGPTYRWNEIINDELLDNFVTLPLAARHLALFHAALDDAVAIARHHRKSPAPDPVALDSLIKSTFQGPKGASASDYAAAASAAAEVLTYIFPARGKVFAAMAEQAIQLRLMAGVEYPSDVVAGRAIGQKVAALAIVRGQSDQSDAKWTGSVPEGPGRWKGANPIAPLTATWRPWVLARPDEFRPTAPPAFDSEATRAAVSELKVFARTPKSNHRAIYWEVYGGARAHALWNEIARTKLLENRDALTPVTAARVLAALNIAFLDAAIACWDAKYTYWFIRPSQLDPELKPVFPPPNHPSYPAAHGCLSTAAATVLAGAFPIDRDKLLAQGREAAEARIWAGIHYRFDIDAGQEIGRKVGERTLERAFLNR